MSAGGAGLNTKAFHITLNLDLGKTKEKNVQNE